MPARITPGSVKIITQDGEVQVLITLELNINLNTNGMIGVTAETKETKLERPIEDTAWAIPDFESTKINFGKKG